MPNELLPGMTNVVRFPVELRARPTIELLRAVAPDIREVFAIADSFGLEAPVPGLREWVDAETAEHILNHFSGDGTFLNGLFEPVLAAAIAASRAAHDTALEAAEARQAVLRAQNAGQVWLQPLQERAEALTRLAAERLLIAHALAEEAEGVARAVGFARRGEPWTPHDPRGEAAKLFGLAD